MTTNKYMEHLEDRMRAVRSRIAEAQAHLKDGAPREKVEAAAELTTLQTQYDELSGKLDAAKEQHSEDWSPLHAEMQEHADVILRSVEKWITRHT